MIKKNLYMPWSLSMPALSPTMTQGHLVKWHKEEGEKVFSGDVLLDIETDKAVMEVEATEDGILEKILVPAPTSSVIVGTPIALFRAADESEEAVALFIEESSLSLSPPKSLHVSSSLKKEEPKPSFKEECHQERKISSPLARKIAQLHGIDWRALKGTGPRGRVVKKDVEAVLQPVLQASQEVVPLTAMRRIIAQRLTLSKQTIPHFYLSIECSMDSLLNLRKNLNRKEKKFSINDFMMRACALSLSQVPALQYMWGEEGLIPSPHVDLAMAVSIEGGLITPFVTQADTKSLTLLSQECKSLIERARQGKLLSHEYQGGSFTLSNLGMTGISHFQPIINPPHAGILAIGSCGPRALVNHEGNLMVGQAITATLAADHRVVDGQEGAHFLKIFKEYIEEPYQLLS